jgi:hypothetical protein
MIMGTKFSIKDELDKYDAEVEQMANELWGGNTIGGVAPGTELFDSPAFQELVHILLAQPILVAPCLNFLRLKQAQMSRAQLEVLYTPEELAVLYAKLEAEDSK